jgi:hypothetical protein
MQICITSRIDWLDIPYIMLDRKRGLSRLVFDLMELMMNMSVTSTMFSQSEDEAIFGAPSTPAKAINFSKVHAMFNSALKNKLTKAFFRADHGLLLSLAPATGKNPGAIYVKQNGAYKGKIVNGKLIPAEVISLTVMDELRKVADDPHAYAVSYGRMTGNCCICGTGLTNAKSVALGIGPICAANYGFSISAEEVEEAYETVEINGAVVNRKQLSDILGDVAADKLFAHFVK